MADGTVARLVRRTSFQYHPSIVNVLKHSSPGRATPYHWLLLILLLAAALRLAAIDEIPPGMTHDEADHGLDAWGIVNGIRPIYFTVGYGREPLFDYATAGLMSFLGPSYLAGRLTAAFFSLLLVAGSYAWSRQAFGRRVGLLTAAGLAVSFWGVMSGRQALRSITLPALFVLAAALFWWAANGREQDTRRKTALFLVAGLLLGLTFYAYIPARILWTIFPLTLLAAALAAREWLGRTWRGTLLMLALAGLVAVPLLYYLATYPEAERRIGQLNRPLIALSEGNWIPLLENAAGSLRLFTIQGDPTWRYNLPGRPWLEPGLGFLFYIGLALAGWRTLRPRSDRSRPAHFFALSWLGAGLAPSLITGPDLSMTQAIGVLPVLYLFPALALDAAADWLPSPHKRRRQLAHLAVGLLFGITLLLTVRDYFIRWANAPEVRVQYETSLVTALDYVNDSNGGSVALSTTTPGQFHSPAVGLMYLDNPAITLHWFNGQHSLLLPQDRATQLIFSGFAPLHPTLAGYLPRPPVATLPLRPTDLDRPLQVYRLDGPAALAAIQPQFNREPAEPGLPAQFGDAARLLGYKMTTAAAPGEALHLATLWQVQGPTAAELVLFSHLLNANGELVAQADRLDVPSTQWHPGDIFIQLHTIPLPPDLPPGEYQLMTGLYQAENGQRLPIQAADVDAVQLTAVTVP